MSGTRKFLLKTVVLVVVLGAVALFVKAKKETLVREGADFLQAMLSRESKLDVKIGKISGKLFGIIRFDHVRLENPSLPAGLSVLFRAERVEFRYRPWEFFTKKFQPKSKIVVTVTNPEIYWRPSVRLRSDPLPFLDWLRDAGLSQRQHLELHVRNLTLFLGVDRRAFPGIALDYANDHFDIQMPVRHFTVLENDLNSELRLTGDLKWGVLSSEDSVTGRLITEGTVVNWQPLPWESKVDFKLTRQGLHLESSDLLGGFDAEGDVVFQRGGQLNLSIRTENYPLKNFEPLLGRGETGTYDGTLDLEARFQGPLDALSTDVHATLHGGKSGRGHYRALSLHANGVYPTLRLSDSQIVAEDGLIMRLADATIEFGDLFDASMYRRLVAGVSQDEVSSGDWGFRREVDENQLPEFLMERSLTERAWVQLRKYNAPEERQLFRPIEEEDKRDVEVGFTYRLRSQDSVKYTVREDEQFVGIERKMSF